MTEQTRKYRDGDIVFREGEPSRNAFVVVEGKVELLKLGPSGAIQLAVLGVGEMLGEMGVLDGGPRSATARAMGPTVLRVVAKDALLKDVQKKPGLAMSLINKLIERLRRADDMLVAKGAPSRLPVPTATQAPAGTPTVGGSLFKRVIAGGAATVAQVRHGAMLDVVIADLVGDTPDHARTKHVLVDLGFRLGVNARALGRPLAPDPGGDPHLQLTAVVARGRQWLNEVGGEVLVWGAVVGDGRGLRLRLISAVEDDDSRPAGFGSASVLDLPAAFDNDQGNLLMAAIAANAVPRIEAQRVWLRDTLTGTVDGSRKLVGKPPIELDRFGQATISAAYGTAAAAAFAYTSEPRYAQEAKTALQNALKALARTNARFESALVQRTLGAVLENLGERDPNPTGEALLGEAVSAYREALTVLTRADFPIAWATTQHRLGKLLFRIDRRLGDTTMVKEACTAFQLALQVFSIEQTPLRWAEAKHNLAQALQTIAGDARSPEFADKAADTCRDTIVVRSRDRYPLLWAETQNSLGAALFLKAKLSADLGPLEDAAEAFQGALEVYRAAGFAKRAAVVKKNLARIEGIFAQRQLRAAQTATRPHWFDEPDTIANDLPSDDGENR